MTSKVGIYARISRSDNLDLNISIKHQIEGITQYCNLKHFSITKIYKDIEYSGKSFDRPAFKKLMQDIEDGIINTIIVKDLSRFGRNHLEVGKYLEETFLINDIRFIAIDDNYDNQGIMDEFAVFKNIFNEMYLKDIKRKVKTTFDFKARTTLLNSKLGAFYGLTLDENQKLIIDEKPAKTVKRIYDLYIQGLTTKQIAELLNKENVISPGEYRYKQYNDKSGLKNTKSVWRDCSIYKILTNESYTGKIINRKYIYVKGKRILNPNPDIIENGLPVIIDASIFQKVQEISSKRPKKKEKVYCSPFLDMIQCGHCSKQMRYIYSQTMNDYLYCCPKCRTRIYLQDLTNIFKEDISKQLISIQNKDIKKHKHTKISKLKEEIKKVELEIRKEFERYANNKISEATFLDNMKQLIFKKEQFTLEINNQEKTILHSLGECLEGIEIDKLINKLVKEVVVKSTGKRKYDVHLWYKFKNQIDLN
ncbi:MAG: recombinase family protein [Roseburia sp.]|nr:recombinase family protein [Anaeroplasma bactoclasticum]MCM1196358.1 recombinase family protein [Roseburia sp.]